MLRGGYWHRERANEKFAGASACQSIAEERKYCEKRGAQCYECDGSSLRSSNLVPFVPANLSLLGRRLHPHLG